MRTPVRSRAPVAVAGICAVRAVAGCGSSAPTKTQPAPTPAQIAVKARARLAAEYLALAKLSNRAGDAYQAHPTAANGRAYTNVLQVFDNHVLRLGATGQTEADIRTMVRLDAQFLAAWKSGNYSAASSLGDQSNTAANIVRADLGLPPPPK